MRSKKQSRTVCSGCGWTADDVDPLAHLTDVLTRIVNDHSNPDIEAEAVLAATPVKTSAYQFSVPLRRSTASGRSSCIVGTTDF